MATHPESTGSTNRQICETVRSAFGLTIPSNDEKSMDSSKSTEKPAEGTPKVETCTEIRDSGTNGKLLEPETAPALSNAETDVNLGHRNPLLNEIKQNP